VKWPRPTGDVETSEERGKTTRSLYLSQSKVSIDHLIQHCRPRQTFIIGVSGDSHALAPSALVNSIAVPAAAPPWIKLTFPSTTNPSKQPPARPTYPSFEHSYVPSSLSWKLTWTTLKLTKLVSYSV
jgi:hypothetical protein